MKTTRHARSHTLRKPRRRPSSALAALLVALLALTGVPLIVPAEAATISAGEAMPGELIPVMAGPDLDQPTLVPEQPRGARAATATFQVTYSGFTPQAQAAFQRAVDIWSSQLTSPVPIVVNASFASLASGVLGSAGAVNSRRNFTGAPQANTWYPNALANKLAGSDLAPGEADITAQFSSNFSNWYYGDGNTPAGQYNFTSVVLHELGHGLGFFGSGRVQGGSGNWGLGTGTPYGYDRAVYNGAGQQVIATFPNPSAALAEQYTGNSLYFNGPNANAANGGTPPRLYAPSTWAQGSSYSHLNESTYPPGNPNSLMTYAIGPGETIYDPGPVTRGIFADLGWTTGGSTPSSRFADVPTNYWAYSQIEQLVARGITTGCDTNLYCPEEAVTRAQMAAFIIRTLTGTTAAPPGPATPSFSDVPTNHPQYGFIEDLVQRQITTGCGTGEYCPIRPVNRAEMAAFIIRAVTGSTTQPTGPATPTFADVPASHPQYGYIEDLVDRGVTTGCRTEGGVRYYCPGANVTRAEMAVFIVRAFPAP